MRLTSVLAAAALGALSGPAESQEALAREYGYKLAGQTPEASYFLSNIRRGAEPESVQAWVWTVSHTVDSAVDTHDAKAELAILRCSGRSIEVLKTEFYHEGSLLSAVEEPPSVPKQIRADTAMDLAWHVACDMDRRYSVQTVTDIAAVYRIAR